MKTEYKLLLIGSLAIILLDSAFAGMTLKWRISEAILWPASFFLYFLFTYIAATRWRIRNTIFFGTFLGLIDATIGWKVATCINPNAIPALKNASLAAWSVKVLLVMIVGILISLLSIFKVSQEKKQKAN